jgi:hypothetical protein
MNVEEYKSRSNIFSKIGFVLLFVGMVFAMLYLNEFAVLSVCISVFFFGKSDEAYYNFLVLGGEKDGFSRIWSKFIKKFRPTKKGDCGK